MVNTKITRIRSADEERENETGRSAGPSAAAHLLHKMNNWPGVRDIIRFALKTGFR